jgi:hypothetical protein
MKLKNGGILKLKKNNKKKALSQFKWNLNE